MTRITAPNGSPPVFDSEFSSAEIDAQVEMLGACPKPVEDCLFCRAITTELLAMGFGT